MYVRVLVYLSVKHFDMRDFSTSFQYSIFEIATFYPWLGEIIVPGFSKTKLREDFPLITS